jgi:hypothetical protein
MIVLPVVSNDTACDPFPNRRTSTVGSRLAHFPTTEHLPLDQQCSNGSCTAVSNGTFIFQHLDILIAIAQLAENLGSVG